jgi:hypothetical protein
MLCAELHPFSIKSHLHCQKTVIFYYLISQLYIYIYINVTWLYTSSNLLASAKATFGNTLVMGQREHLSPNKTTIPLQYMFPCNNNSAQNAEINLTTSSLTKHSRLSLPTIAWQQLYPPTHTHTHMRAMKTYNFG